MTGADVAQIIVALATLVSSVGALLVGWRNSRKIEQVHRATNSMKDELVLSTALAARAEGNLAGRRELKGEQSRSRK